MNAVQEEEDYFKNLNVLKLLLNNEYSDRLFELTIKINVL
jgi:hypothetical protein